MLPDSLETPFYLIENLRFWAIKWTHDLVHVYSEAISMEFSGTCFQEKDDRIAVELSKLNYPVLLWIVR